jgi:hypothetical protein
VDKVKVSALVMGAAVALTWVIYEALQPWTIVSSWGMTFIFAIVLVCILAGGSIAKWIKNRGHH